MGYDGDKRRGFSFGGTTANILIRNNDFHHWWYAFYSAGSRNVTIDKNEYHDNYRYAIDPLSGTHDMKITNNHVHNNRYDRIICSEDCSDILIERNVVHDHNDHGSTGIFLSKNMHNSIVRDNLVYNSLKGINIQGSPDNEIYNNTIRNTSIAFYLSNPSSGNIRVIAGNKVYNNNVENAEFGVASFDTADNVFSNNTFVNTRSHEFYLWGGSEIEVEDQASANYRIAGDSGAIIISNSGAIEVEGQTFDTDGTPHEIRLRDNMTIVISSTLAD